MLLAKSIIKFTQRYTLLFNKSYSKLIFANKNRTFLVLLFLYKLYRIFICFFYLKEGQNQFVWDSFQQNIQLCTLSRLHFSSGHQSDTSKFCQKVHSATWELSGSWSINNGNSEKMPFACSSLHLLKTVKIHEAGNWESRKKPQYQPTNRSMGKIQKGWAASEGE